MFKNVVVSVFLSFFVVIIVHGIIFGGTDRLVDRDFTSLHRNARTAAVNDSDAIRIAGVYNNSEWLERLLVDSMKKTAELINSRGGISGRKLELSFHDVQGDQIENLARIQTVCSPADVAVCVGPFKSDYVVPARSITTFSSVPLVSPSAVYSEKLRSLDNDSYVTLFPPLKALVNATLDHMNRQKIDDLVIVCPENGTYGDLYSTLLERYSQQIGGFHIIHRLTYQTPFNEFVVSSLLKSVLSRHQFDAVFYAGGTADFDKFMSVYSSLGLSVPVYATEIINTPSVRDAGYNTRIYIPFFNTDYLQANITGEYRIPLDENNPDFSFMAQWLINEVAEYLAEGNYDPVEMSDRIRRKTALVYENMDLNAAFFIDSISGPGRDDTAAGDGSGETFTGENRK